MLPKSKDPSMIPAYLRPADNAGKFLTPSLLSRTHECRQRILPGSAVGRSGYPMHPLYQRAVGFKKEMLRALQSPSGRTGEGTLDSIIKSAEADARWKLPKSFTEPTPASSQPSSPIEMGIDWTSVDLTSTLASHLQPYGDVLDSKVSFTTIDTQVRDDLGQHLASQFGLRLTSYLGDTARRGKLEAWLPNGAPLTSTWCTSTTFDRVDSGDLWVPLRLKQRSSWNYPDPSSPTVTPKWSEKKSPYDHNFGPYYFKNAYFGTVHSTPTYWYTGVITLENWLVGDIMAKAHDEDLYF